MSRPKAIKYIESKLKKHQRKKNKKKAASKKEMLKQLKTKNKEDCKKKYDKLLLKYEALKKEHKALQSQMDKVRVGKNGSSKKSKSVKKTSSKAKKPAEISPISILPPPKPKEAESSILNRITEKASTVNFERIGRSSSQDRDDLKRIKGIGPMIESRLNALGIYTFAQISKFSPKDEVIVNDAIEFFQGRISRDNWVEQASALMEMDSV